MWYSQPEHHRPAGGLGSGTQVGGGRAQVSWAITTGEVCRWGWPGPGTRGGSGQDWLKSLLTGAAHLSCLLNTWEADRHLQHTCPEATQAFCPHHPKCFPVVLSQLTRRPKDPFLSPSQTAACQCPAAPPLWRHEPCLAASAPEANPPTPRFPSLPL